MAPNGALSKKVYATINRFGLLSPGDRVLIGVSGGADSVCLTVILWELASELKLDIAIAHLHHGLRGEEATGDQEFVGSFARQLGFPFFTKVVDLPSFAREKGVSKQVAGRILRYEFFEAVAKQINSQRIALGHTLDDQGETLLMRMLRGTGSDGFKGIPIDRNGRIVRPLLMVERWEIEQYLKERGIPFREDSSNKESFYFRNRVRRNLLPYLKKRFNPRIREVLSREALILFQEGEFVEKEAQRFYHQNGFKENGEVQFEIEGLKSLHPALRWRVFRMAVRDLPLENENIEFKHVLAIDELLEKNRVGSERHLPHGLRVLRESKRLTFLRHQTFQTISSTFPLLVPGVVEIDFAHVKVTTQLTDEWVEKPSGDRAVFDWKKTPRPLEVRSWRRGDFFYPRGLGGRKKLHDFFVDKKIPRRRRNVIPLLASPQGVLWVMGLRLDGRFLANGETGTKLVINFQKRA